MTRERKANAAYCQSYNGLSITQALEGRRKFASKFSGRWTMRIILLSFKVMLSPAFAFPSSSHTERSACRDVHKKTYHGWVIIRKVFSIDFHRFSLLLFPPKIWLNTFTTQQDPYQLNGRLAINLKRRSLDIFITSKSENEFNLRLDHETRGN